MKKEEFEILYRTNSDISKEFYREHFLTLPCKCEDEDCYGWACVSNTPTSIKAHNKFYS